MRLLNRIAHTFYEMSGRKIIWYERDEKNLLKQHHEHAEYRDIEGIKECLKNPDQINRSRSNNDRRLIYYRNRGNFQTQWHQVVIKVCKNWEYEEAGNNKKYAVLITTQYLDKININEEKIWP